MKVRPFSAADLLRQNSPRKFATIPNRIAYLRDESPAPGSDNGRRFRSTSVNPKPEDPSSYAAMASKILSSISAPQVDDQTLEQVGINSAKVTSLIDKVKTELVTLGVEPEICTIFNDLCEDIKCINDSQQLLSSRKYFNAQSQASALPAPPKKVKQNPLSSSQAPIFVDISRSQTQSQLNRRRKPTTGDSRKRSRRPRDPLSSSTLTWVRYL